MDLDRGSWDKQKLKFYRFQLAWLGLQLFNLSDVSSSCLLTPMLQKSVLYLNPLKSQKFCEPTYVKVKQKVEKYVAIAINKLKNFKNYCSRLTISVPGRISKDLPTECRGCGFLL